MLTNFFNFHRVFLAVLLAFSFWSFSIFVREYNGFYAGARTGERLYIVSDNAFPVRPYGLKSASREIERCFIGLSGLNRSVLTKETQNKGAANCERLADQILNRAPTHAAAQQLRSEAALFLGDSATGFAAARASALVGPNTIWLHKRRLLQILTLPNVPRSDFETLAQDAVSRIIEIPQDRIWLAQIYEFYPAIRPVIGGLQGQITAAAADDFARKLRSVVAQKRRDNQTAPATGGAE